MTVEIEYAAAYDLAASKIDLISATIGVPLEITKWIEVESGWVFFFNSSIYLSSHDSSDALAGNGPVLVTKNGAIHELPSSVHWEKAVMMIGGR